MCIRCKSIFYHALYFSLVSDITDNKFCILMFPCSNHNDGKSRALDNIGRSYARIGNYEKAVERYAMHLLVKK